MELDIEGLDELIEFISTLEDGAERAKDEALIAGGDYLKEKIQSEVYSHGLKRRTGDAQESIVRTNPKDGSVFVGTQGGKRAKGYYLYMHEFGYWNVRAKRFIAPKPLVSIVYENNKNAILQKYAEVFRRRWGL